MAVEITAPANATAKNRVPHGPVRATLNFYKPPADGAEPFNYVDTPPAEEPQRNFSDAPHEVWIDDIRGREAEFKTSPASLDKNAFLLVTDQPPSAEVEFVDDASIEAAYYPEVEALLLKHIPGASRVVIFDHTVRRSQPEAKRTPVTRVHIDQTGRSAAMRVRKHLPADEAERLLQGRYRIVNVWRPLNKEPVESFPLAFASSASVADADLVPVQHRYSQAHGGYVGETAAVRHHPDQKWYYFSGMTSRDRLLLECFDSEALQTGSGVDGGRLVHTAFDDPRSLPDAKGRESIEVRTLVFGP